MKTNRKARKQKQGNKNKTIVYQNLVLYQNLAL